jgi:hypothetical protein
MEGEPAALIASSIANKVSRSRRLVAMNVSRKVR